jgi:hypothetical protein
MGSVGGTIRNKGIIFFKIDKIIFVYLFGFGIEVSSTYSLTEDFLKQKIIYPDISEKLSFCLCNEEIYCSNTAYFISSKTENLEYLLKYINSNLINWYYKTLSVQLGTVAVRMFSIYVLNIPIPKNRTESIYESYALTEDEIKFIESISCNS